MTPRILNRKSYLSLIGLLILFLLACDATVAVGYPTPTLPPPSITPSATQPSLKLNLASVSFNENNANPPSTITAQIPQLTGSDDMRVATFNQVINTLVMSEIESFKQGLVGLPSPPSIAVSTFDVKYTVVYQGGDLWSLKFDLAVYVDGTAHPGDLVHTLNYDFAHSRALSLNHLFLVDSNYLEVISKYCAAELSEREIGFDETTVGAEPTLQNYRNWNLSEVGLVITFERGQVAAYAAPAQIVTIPYAELSALIDPQGPLAGWAK